MQSILIFEEDEVVRGLVQVIVESAGYFAVTAANGEDALKIAQHRRVSAIVLDCLAPSGEGVQTLMRLRADANTTAIPVIAMCGLGQYGAELGLWATSVLVKPFRASQLLLKLQYLVTRIQPTEASNALHALALAT